MKKSLKNIQELNKKAAYDLGRKSIYFIVAIIVIALIFVYVSNSIKSYQFESLKYVNEVMYLTQVKGIEKCISYEDNDRAYLGKLNRLDLDIAFIKNCLEKDEILKDKEFRITVEGKQRIETTDNPMIEYNSYTKYFLLQNQIKEITIDIEK